MSITAPMIRTPLWWGLAGLCGVLLLLQLLLSSLLVLGDESAAMQAQQHGQRLWLSLDAANQPPAQTATTRPNQLPEAAAATTHHAATGTPKASTEDLMAEFAISEAESAATARETPAPATNSTESFVASEQDVIDAIPAEPRTAASLAAPLDALLDPWQGGALPMRDGDNTPFSTYRRPFTPPTPAKPIIALLITDLGAMRAPTQTATELPADVTLGFSPYARNSAAWLQTARNRGLESWLMLPAQPDNFPADDAGPDALLVEQAPEESLLRLKRSMARAQGYSGLILPVNEAYSDHFEALGWLNGQIESRGLALIAAKRPTNSAAVGWFKRQQRAYAGDLLLDETLSVEAMQKQFAALETIANQQGHAMGVIRGYPLSLKMADSWLKGLKARGFVLAPASAVLALSVQ